MIIERRLWGLNSCKAFFLCLRKFDSFNFKLHWGAPTIGIGYEASKGTIDINQALCRIPNNAIF